MTGRNSQRLVENRFAYQATALQVLLAAKSLGWLSRKANFHPDQPRVPRGDPDGGQWTDTGRGAGQGESARVIRVSDDGNEPFYDGPDEDLDESAIQEVFRIPHAHPGSMGETYAIIRPLAGAAARRAQGGMAPRQYLESIKAPEWVYRYRPHIEAYLSRPKSLKELQADVRNAALGYDIHHIVERGPALLEGYPRAMINHPENLVRIPRFKHWEVTGRSMKINRQYSGLSPRQFLRNKSWAEKRQVGIDILKDSGVLK